MKQKYKELEEVEAIEISMIPDWQKEQVRKEIENIKNGTTKLLDWEDVQKQLKIPN